MHVVRETASHITVTGVLVLADPSGLPAHEAVWIYFQCFGQNTFISFILEDTKSCLSIEPSSV